MTEPANATASPSESGNPPDRPPTVALITVTYNAARYIGRFLDDVASLSYPRLHVIVVDCASRDGSADLVEQRCPTATVICLSENLGFTGGNNLAIEAARALQADYVLFINPDTQLRPDLVEQLVARAAPRRLVVPRVELQSAPGHLDDTAGDFDWSRGVWRDWVLGRTDAAALRREGEVGMASLCCLLAPLAIFRHAGMLDERLFMYYEDFDWVARAQSAGYQVWYVPEPLVWHQRAAASGGGDNPFKVYYATRNRVLVLRRYQSSSRFMWFSAWFLLSRLVRLAGYLRGGRPDLARALASGVRDAFLGRTGRRWRPPTST